MRRLHLPRSRGRVRERGSSSRDQGVNDGEWVAPVS
jgi:hypothetical protein